MDIIHHNYDSLYNKLKEYKIEILLLLLFIIFVFFYIFKKKPPLNTKIPKIIHQTYPNKKISYEIKENIKELKELNPGYEYYLYDDNDVEDFIKTYYNDDILKTYYKINPDYGPARADFFRYLLMYIKGGIYLDIKSSCSISFDSIINEDDEYILSHWGIGKTHWKNILKNKEGEYCNWFIIIKEKHPLMKKIIDEIINNINNYNVKKYGIGKIGVLNLTGPIAYSKVILKHKDNYKLRIYRDYKDINLMYTIYNNHNKHFNLFKNHYTKLRTPIIKDI